MASSVWTGYLTIGLISMAALKQSLGRMKKGPQRVEAAQEQSEFAVKRNPRAKRKPAWKAA